MFTSDTTADPRLVRITYENIQANTFSIIESLGLDSSRKIMAILLLFYCIGTSLLHTTCASVEHWWRRMVLS